MNRKLRRKLRYIPHLFIFALITVGMLYFIKSQARNIKSIVPPLKSNVEKSHIVNPVIEKVDPSYFEKKMKEQNIPIYQIEVSPDSLEIIATIQDGPKVIFSPTKDADFQVSTLQSILLRLTIENKKASEINFTFDKPIVNY